MPRITLTSSGQTWTGFQSVSIRKSLDDIVHALSLTTTDRGNEGIERWNVRGGSIIQVHIDGALVFDGYVTRYSPVIGPELHSIRIDASSRPIDLVESGHHGKVFWKNVSAESIVQEVIAPFGLGVDIQSPMRAIDRGGALGLALVKARFPLSGNLLRRTVLRFILWWMARWFYLAHLARKLSARSVAGNMFR